MTGERAIDPESRDYSQDSTGEFETADDLGNEIFKRWQQVAGESPLEPNVGRVKRTRLKDTARTREQLLKDCATALQPILDAGRASDITGYEVVPANPVKGKMHLRADVVEITGRVQTYSTWIEVA